MINRIENLMKLTNREQAIAEVFTEMVIAAIERFRMTERIKTLDPKQMYWKIWKYVETNEQFQKQVENRISTLNLQDIEKKKVALEYRRKHGLSIPTDENFNPDTNYSIIGAAMLQDAPAVRKD